MTGILVRIIGTIILFYVVVFVVIKCLNWECEEVVTDKTIISVGGCDKHGYCGIKLSDGSFDSERYPVIGRRITKMVCK